jgi:peptidyl-prolyl cis-trans isomerase B (cyclophilin B)
MRSRWVLTTVVTTMFGLVTATQAEAAPAKAPFVECEFTPTPENPAARPVVRPSPYALTVGKARVTFRTNYGPIVVDLDRGGAAPCAVHNMVSLVFQHFYDHSQCWRLTDSARLGVLQCGDIYKVEEGGPGYKFPDEVSGKETYERGTIAMGNQGPGTNGSEFFIVHSFAHIPANYSVLGKVVRGMAAIDHMVKDGIIPSTPGGPLDGAPAHPVKINTVTPW